MQHEVVCITGKKGTSVISIVQVDVCTQMNGGSSQEKKKHGKIAYAKNCTVNTWRHGNTHTAIQTERFMHMP